MIKRINLIEKKAFSFTYQKLTQICIGIVVLNLLSFGYQAFQVSRMHKDIEAKKIEMKKLEVEKSMLMKRPAKKRVNVGGHQDLINKIQDSAKWSVILNEITLSLPNAVWITTFKSNNKKAPKVATKKKKNDKKNDKKEVVVVPRNKFEVSGLGRGMRNITEFTINLSKSVYFYSPTLTDSAKEGYGFSFTIKSEIDTNHVQ
jgi:hypothetical protein